MKFVDRLQAAINKTGSYVVAGFDPLIDGFPAFIRAEARRLQGAEKVAYFALSEMYNLAIEALVGIVPAVKPNIAFFEQYGIGGMRAFADICAAARKAGFIVIADVKRGDIGSTAQAYSQAYLGKVGFLSHHETPFDVDAITVNPFLGFDTIEVFLNDCVKHEKGIFVLVKTSNPGSGGIQGLPVPTTDQPARTVSDHVANWCAEQAPKLLGTSGYSGLGAVVGATYPEQARALRRLMPKNFFLIPGLGAQGGSAADAVAGFGSVGGRPGGAIVNVSRGLFLKDLAAATTRPQALALLRQAAGDFNRMIKEAIG